MCSFLIIVCFGRHARWGILGSYGRRNLLSLLWQVSPPRFIWACRISQWTPAQLPRASASRSRLPRQIRSARAAPFILALASIPYVLFTRYWPAYLAIRGDGPGPLFLCQNGQPLSCTLLTNWLRQIMASAGISSNFSSHSFRIGVATVAGRNGIPDHLIQELGRWKSNAFQSYIRTPSAALASLSQKLV